MPTDERGQRETVKRQQPNERVRHKGSPQRGAAWNERTDPSVYLIFVRKNFEKKEGGKDDSGEYPASSDARICQILRTRIEWSFSSPINGIQSPVIRQTP